MTATMTFLCEDYYEAPCTQCDGSGEIERQDQDICSWKRARAEYPDLISVEITPGEIK